MRLHDHHATIRGPAPGTILLVFWLCILALPAPAAERLTVRIGFYENPPKLFLGHQDSPRGIFPEILSHIAQTENWEIRWVPGTWQEGIDRLETGRIDIMPDVAYSLKRAEKYTFSNEPVLVNWATIYSRVGLNISSLPDLDRRKIGVMRGSIHTGGPEGIRQQVAGFNLSCTFVEFDSYGEIFQALHNNLIDAGVVNRLYGLTAQELYDVLPTRIVFNPRHLKFAFPTDGPLTDTLKKTIDHRLRSAALQPDSWLRLIIQSNLRGLPAELTGGAPDGAVYLTPEEKAWIQAHPKIRVGVDPEFAPFEFIDKNGRCSGFTSDYLQILRERLGLNLVRTENLTWKEVMQGAAKKEIDLLAAVGFTAERSSFLAYTIPYTGFYRMIFSRTDIPFISGTRDLEDLRVAVQAGSSHAGWLREQTGFRPMYYDTLKETIEAVADNRADVFIGNMAASTYWIRKLNITNIRAAAPVSLERQLLHMAVRKDWPILVNILNKGLASVSPQRAEEIRDRWIAAGYSVGVPEGLVRRRIILVLSAALLFILVFWYWNRRLKHEVILRGEAEKALRRSREQLADQVSEQTRELIRTNAILKREMAVKEELLNKLHRSEKMESLGLMAGGVAHYLNNILAGVVSYPDLLLLELPENSPLRGPLEVIKDSGTRAAAVVADLLTITRGVALEKKNHDIVTLLEECLDSPEYRDLAERFPEIHCRILPGPGPHDIFCAPVHVKKSIMNLIANAFEAVGKKGEVTVSTRNVLIEQENPNQPGPGNWVILRVADTGPGIAPDDLPRVFEPFYSKKILGRSGTGLGLAIVWNTVQDHGGTVTVDSDDRGTVFSLFFPVTDHQDCPVPEDMNEENLRGNGETILVVDDEERQRDIACRILESLGYQARSAASGEEALAFLGGNRADLVLLDMIMEPGMDGLQTYREIQRIAPGQKAIIVSGFSENSAVAETMRLGASCFIRKPYICTRLGFAVKRGLHESG